jgi:hypothetical protein
LTWKRETFRVVAIRGSHELLERVYILFSTPPDFRKWRNGTRR